MNIQRKCHGIDSSPLLYKAALHYAIARFKSLVPNGMYTYGLEKKFQEI